jgi:SAM-dependent methyltransferase
MWIADRLLFPLLALLSPEQSRRIGLTPIDDERLLICLKYARGFVLDVGCGPNRLVNRHSGGGVGVDVYPWRGVSAVAASHALPFPDQSFDTVTMLAMLNHIPSPRRTESLSEVTHVLRPDGALLITMINPAIGWITHRIRRRHDPDQTERGIGADEDWGLSDGQVRRLLAEAGLKVVRRQRFVWWLNNLYICRKSTSPLA